jgi:hypothetical protein
MVGLSVLCQKNFLIFWEKIKQKRNAGFPGRESAVLYRRVTAGRC